ncbi:RtcB family protein [bacterium]|nr:RtcB family protein [bacterium]
MDVKIKKIGEHRYTISKADHPGLAADIIIYATEDILEAIRKDQTYVQIVNVACMPGVVSPVHLMPDAHFGYGFPIGAVAAFDAVDGWVSPGGVGADINCGVRLMATSIPAADLDAARKKSLVEEMFRKIPSGLGVGGPIRLEGRSLDDVLERGAPAIVEKGFGVPEDLKHIEDSGSIEGADPDAVSDAAKKRGRDQCGTMGSGNHFMEVQAVEKVFEPDLAARWGVAEGTLAVMIHSGSRGLGYQVSDEFWKRSKKALSEFNISIADAQLSPLPVRHELGREYLAAMRAAANYAFANRQALMHLSRKVFEREFGGKAESLGLKLVYDVAHNIAKEETYETEGRKRSLLVHRKGATRAFPGQPVIIPGDMGTASYLLVGTDEAVRSYFTVCHGAGRVLSRTAAKKRVDVGKLVASLREKGIEVRGGSKAGLAEEAPEAYKDIEQVVEAVVVNGLAKRVARLRPLCVIKG